jgi:hypothetical protein
MIHSDERVTYGERRDRLPDRPPTSRARKDAKTIGAPSEPRSEANEAGHLSDGSPSLSNDRRYEADVPRSAVWRPR